MRVRALAGDAHFARAVERFHIEARELETRSPLE
jgi:hypothetical protein